MYSLDIFIYVTYLLIARDCLANSHVVCHRAKAKTSYDLSKLLLNIRRSQAEYQSSVVLSNLALLKTDCSQETGEPTGSHVGLQVTTRVLGFFFTTPAPFRGD